VSAISNILIPLLKLWLRSQTEKIEKLEITIEGNSWQIMKGNIPYAQISAEQIIYQGLAITTAHISTAHIHLNVPQLLKGEPLKLLNPIYIQLQAFLDSPAVHQCLNSALFQQAIHDLDINYSPPTNDPELTHLLHTLVVKLGEQLQLQELTVQNGTINLCALLPIQAT
jgi:hypothetical protein